MVDILNKPSQKQVELLKKNLDDPFLANLVVTVIKDLKNRERNLERLWCSMSRQMFHNFPAAIVYEMVAIALYEASDEQWFEKKYPNWVFKDTPPKLKMEMSEYTGIKNLLSTKLKITQVAKMYGLKVRGSKVICPFHIDTQPSLGLSDEKNVFHCFGCGIKGDIIKFVNLMENEKERSSNKSN